jgi:SAM-dependent methyltransferase
MIYSAINQVVFEHIPTTSKRILDIGCGSGNLGREVKRRASCEVVGVTYSEAEATMAAEYLDRVIVGDLNKPEFLNAELGKFDCIVCSHILEHLCQPEVLLKTLPKILQPDSILVVALPNALCLKQRLKFLKGEFKYTDGGIMDRTHFRFFDWDTAFDLLQDSGYQVQIRYADGNFPLPGIRNFIKPMALKLDAIASRSMPGLFANQFVLTAQHLSQESHEK